MKTYRRIREIGLLMVLLISLMVGLAPAFAQGGAESLTETAISADGILSLNYPEGWVVDLSIPFATRIASSQAMLEADGVEVPLPAGEFQVIVAEGDLLGMMIPDWDKAASLDEALELVIMDMLDEATTVLSTETITLAGYPAQIAITLQPDREGLVGLIDFDGHYVLVGVNSQIGEYADHADLGLAILDTLRYGTLDSPSDAALPLTETYTLDSGYSFDHPQGWETVYEMNEPDLSLVSLGSSSTVARIGGFNYDFAPGDVWVDFHWEALDNFSGDLDSDSSPVDVLNNSIIGLYPDMGDAVEVQLEGYTVALAEGIHESGKPMMAIFFFWDEDTICWFLALTAPGEYDQFKPTLLAIAESALPR